MCAPAAPAFAARLHKEQEFRVGVVGRVSLV